MISKAMGIIAFLLLPIFLSLWHRSVYHPQYTRYDVTLYKSLRVYLKDGICGLRLLSMPTKTASRSEFLTSLAYDPRPVKKSLLFRSRRNGPYRVTWFVFPFWLVITLLVLTGTVPLALGPIRTWRRRRNGWCLHCGYDLHTNRSGRCPECGTRVERHRRSAAVRRGVARR